jgi:hypothetical protein
MRVVSVSRTEFKTEDGQVFSIDPPLQEDMTPDEFQEHYDLAAALVGSLQASGHDTTDAEALGRSREDQDSEKSG